MKRGHLFLLGVVVAAALLATTAVSVLHDGLSARAQPSALETTIARSARKMAAPSGAHHTKNPVPDSPEVQHDARLHFADHCAVCHGNDGSGDTMFGHGMYPKPPDLRAAETQNMTDGDIFWIIQNGIRLTGMPAFGGEGDHDAEDSWKLVRFIRHLPSLTTEEQLEMEQYNPKGPDERAEEDQEEKFLKGGAAPAAGSHHHQ